MIAFTVPGGGKTIAAVVGVLVVYILVFHVFVSDETKIRRIVETTVDGYNAPDVGDAIDGLADDFEFLSAKGRKIADKQEIRGYLAGQVLQSRDPATNRYNLTLEVIEDSIRITFDDDSKTKATLEFDAKGSRTNRDKVDTWSASFTVRVEKGDDGWKAKSAQLAPGSKRPPF